MAVTVRQKRPGRGNAWHVFIHQNGRIVTRKAGNGTVGILDLLILLANWGPCL